MTWRLAILLSLIWFFNSGIASCEEPADSPPADIVASLNLHRVCVNEEVKLTEAIPAKSEIAIRSIASHVWLIGKYDANRQKLVNSKPDRYMAILRTEDYLPGIIDNITTSNPIELEMLDNYMKGRTQVIKPKKPGVYLIITEWLSTKGTPRMESNPVVLTVLP